MKTACLATQRLGIEEPTHEQLSVSLFRFWSCSKSETSERCCGSQDPRILTRLVNHESSQVFEDAAQPSGKDQLRFFHCVRSPVQMYMCARVELRAPFFVVSECISSPWCFRERHCGIARTFRKTRAMYTLRYVGSSQNIIPAPVVTCLVSQDMCYR